MSVWLFHSILLLNTEINGYCNLKQNYYRVVAFSHDVIQECVLGGDGAFDGVTTQRVQRLDRKHEGCEKPEVRSKVNKKQRRQPERFQKIRLSPGGTIALYSDVQQLHEQQLSKDSLPREEALERR